MNRYLTFFVVFGILIVSGCGEEPASLPTPPPQPSTTTPPSLPTEPQSTTPKAPKIEVTKAEKGVGKKGRDYGDGVIATPIASYFAVRERVAFDIQIPQAMQLFKATEGRAPKSNEEFMEKIIKANHINLPELPEGERYMYYPKEEQLMVEKPVTE